MNFLPVMLRELRTIARHKSTFRIRVLSAALLLIVSFFVSLDFSGGRDSGGQLFAVLHPFIFYSIWLLVPLLVADCLSSEKREGTLGLLFLTPLSGGEIVGAKSVAQIVRSSSICLAALPILSIAFVLGGVGQTQILLLVLICSASLLLALAAGLAASSCCRYWSRAVICSYLFALVLMFVEAWIAGALIPFPAGLFPIGLSPAESIFMIAAQGFAFCQQPFDKLRPPMGGSVLDMLKIATLACALFAITVFLCGRRISRSWQHREASPLQRWTTRTFCTPRFLISHLKRWMARSISKNPVGWLQQRTWTGRMQGMIWFGIAVAISSVAMADSGFTRTYDHVQRVMIWLLEGSLALSAAGSFRRERESGVLELLLVSPLREKQIVLGRLKGLWSLFIPSFLLILFIAVYFRYLLPSDDNYTPASASIVAFLSVPIVGLYFSLRCQTFINAAIWTLFGCFGLPVVCAMLVGVVAPYVVLISGQSAYEYFQKTGVYHIAIFQAAFAVIAWNRLQRMLITRSFSLERAAFS
jgi:ABC-type transport system involved in multi-copper enzyme maturation permease subunit